MPHPDKQLHVDDRPAEPEAKFRWRAPEATTAGPDPFEYDPSFDGIGAPPVAGLRWGRPEDEQVVCTERHVNDVARICPALGHISLKELHEDDVTPHELAEALRCFQKRSLDDIRTQPLAYLRGIIHSRRRERAAKGET